MKTGACGVHGPWWGGLGFLDQRMRGVLPRQQQKHGEDGALHGALIGFAFQGLPGA